METTVGVLRALVGPWLIEAWGEVAGELGGKYEPGGLLRSHVVRVPYGVWEVVLDIRTEYGGRYTYEVTRMRAIFRKAQPMSFTVRRRGVRTLMMGWLGFRSFATGERRFDDSFYVTGSDCQLVGRFLEDPALRGAMQKLGSNFTLALIPDAEWSSAGVLRGNALLRYETVGVLRDVKALLDLFEMFHLSLKQLVIVGAAQESAPRGRL